LSQNRSRNAARRPLLSVAIAFAFVAPLSAAPGTRAHVEPTQLIVKFKEGTGELRNTAQRQQRLDAVGRDHGLHLGQLRRLAVGADVVTADRALDSRHAKALLLQLRADPRVEYAELDASLYPAFAPNDTQYASQWNYFEAIGGINVPIAWDSSTGAGQVVAVLDSGVTSHPDLAANLVAGYDFVSSATYSNDGDGRDSDPSDPGTYSAAGECSTAARNSFWHGTHVAGMIGAVTNNATGVAGVAFGAKVQPVRVIGKCSANTSDISDAIIWAAGGSVSGVPANATPAKVINLSLTGYTPCSATTQAAIDYAVGQGATVVASAGNAALNATQYQPGNCANVITVAATDRAGALASYSNFGSAVDIAAPGGDVDLILSTINTGTTVPVAPGYGGLAGSSKAAAGVSGVVALVRAAGGSGLKAAQMNELLKLTARSMPTPCDFECGAGIVDAGAAVALADDPLLFVSDAVVTEGNSGTRTATFTVSLSKAVGSSILFSIHTVNGTALAGSDYVSQSQTSGWAAGIKSMDFTVPINGDADYEDNETFSVEVYDVSGPIVVADATGTGTITNDDAIELLNGAPFGPLSSEKAYAKTYFTLDVPAGVSNVQFQTFDAGGAVGDVDLYVANGVDPALDYFACQSASVGVNETCDVFGPGTWHGMLYASEPYAEVFVVGSYELPDTDISIGDASVSEGDSGTKVITFTVSLSNASAKTVQYDIATADGSATAGSDYVGTTVVGQLIPAGQLSKTFSVTVNGDTAIESDETFTAQLSMVAGANLIDGTATGTIVNDEGPKLSVGDAAITEGNSGTKVMTFTVSLSEVSASPVTYDIATANNSATAGSDYVASTLVGQSIPAGQLSKTFSVTINGDTTVEANEILRANLTNGSVIVTDAQGTGTIINDDGPVLSIADAGFVEGDSGSKTLVFNVSLSQASGSDVSYNITTNNGTAFPSGDFIASSLVGQTIPAGQTSKTFSVTVNGDTAVEGNETFFVNLSGASVSLADSQAKGTITNDDGAVLSVSDASITEADSGTTMMTFTVSLSQMANGAVTFDFNTIAGSALAGPDYVPVTVSGLKIPAGQLSKVVSVPIKGDLVAEPNETFSATISLSNVSIKDGVGAGTILNDD
jgi:serine protease